MRHALSASGVRESKSGPQILRVVAIAENDKREISLAVGWTRGALITTASIHSSGLYATAIHAGGAKTATVHPTCPQPAAIHPRGSKATTIHAGSAKTATVHPTCPQPAAIHP